MVIFNSYVKLPEGKPMITLMKLPSITILHRLAGWISFMSTYPLVMKKSSAIEHGRFEIVSFPINNAAFPSLTIPIVYRSYRSLSVIMSLLLQSRDSKIGMFHHSLQSGAPKIANLLYHYNFTRVYDIHNYSIHEVVKPINITGGPHIVGKTESITQVYLETPDIQLICSRIVE